MLASHEGLSWRKIESGEYRQQLLGGQCESFLLLGSSTSGLPGISWANGGQSPAQKEGLWLGRVQQGLNIRNQWPVQLQEIENWGWYKPHFQILPKALLFSQVLEPQAETPNCHADRNFFLKILPLTIAKTVASLQFLGKV